MCDKPPPCNPCEYKRPQDLPPAGGYKPIPYKRVPCKQLFSGFTLFAGYAVMTTVSAYLFYLTSEKIKKHAIELRSNKMAIYPMLLAERDREYLRQIRKNREEEDKLMADVPGWVTGTYYGERIYKLLEPDTFVDPIFHEYYAHSDPREWYRRTTLKLRS